MVRIQVPSARESASNRCVFVVSSLAGIVLKLPRVSYLANASATTRDAECLGAGRERPQGLSRPFSSRRMWSVSAGASIEPGMLKELRSGQDIKFAAPTSTTQIDPILRYDLQAMAAGCGLTYHMLSGDLTQANYSSLRAGSIDSLKLVKQLQKHVVIPKWCRPTWSRFIDRAILAGQLRERVRERRTAHFSAVKSFDTFDFTAHSIAQQAADTRTRALRISHRPRQCY